MRHPMVQADSQVARLQWLERELQELKSRMKTHETKHGGHGVPVWQKSDGLWMHADEQLCPTTSSKKPDGGGANFDWGPRSPDLSAKDEPKDDLRAINVTLPRLPWMKAPLRRLSGVEIGSQRLNR